MGSTGQYFDLVVAVWTQTRQGHTAAPGTLCPELILFCLDLGIAARIFGADIVAWQKNHPPPSQNSGSSSISTRTSA